MSPSLNILTSHDVARSTVDDRGRSSLLYVDLHSPPPTMTDQKGNWVYLDDGSKYFDASGGPALSSVGYRNTRVINAIIQQLRTNAIGNDISFRTDVSEELARVLQESTGNKMARAAIYCSGSAATDGALKLAMQTQYERGEGQRFRFIARGQSYHGATLGALGMSGFPSRREMFEGILNDNVSFVSPCDPFRGRLPNESDADMVRRLAKELDDEFHRVGPNTVIAFMAETVVGAALGAMPAVPGYFKAMKEVVNKHGALFIADEVMCGSGRSGGPGLHAWQQEEGFVPDIMTMGKGLSGGYQPIGAVLVSHQVIKSMKQGSGAFAHGQTFQGHPTVCAAALEVLKIIKDERLLGNVTSMGERLSNGLKARLNNHPNVGFISGKGLLWGIHFVRNKETLEPFHMSLQVAKRIYNKALKDYETYVYKGVGSADGINGDHIIISPAYNVTKHDIDRIIDCTVEVIEGFFNDFDATATPSDTLDKMARMEGIHQAVEFFYSEESPRPKIAYEDASTRLGA